MTQLEIATQIFCSGKAETLEHAWRLAGELLLISQPTYDMKIINDTIKESVLTDDEIEAHKERTKNRTEQLVILGYEWDEENKQFSLDGASFIKEDAIANYDQDDWKRTISALESEEHTNFSNDIYNPEVLQDLTDTPISLKEALSVIFGGELYKEFHMEKSTLRLFAIDDRVQVEDDLQVTKKSESKHIIAYADNEEIGLGFTIYKK